MLKLLLFAALCTFGYKVVRSLWSDQGSRAEDPSGSSRTDVIDAQFTEIDTEKEDNR